MKKLALTILAAAGLAGGIGAQAQTMDAPQMLQRVSAFYDLTTLYPAGAQSSNFNGFGVGYNADFLVSKNLPLYVGTGISAHFQFFEKDLINPEVFDAVEQEANVTFINFDIPVNLSYRVPVAPAFYFTPEFGLDFRLQAYGHATIDTDIEHRVPGMDMSAFEDGERGINLFSDKDMASEHLRRFQMGWHAALSFEYHNVDFGLSYGTDFVKLHRSLGAGHFLISLGYTF